MTYKNVGNARNSDNVDSADNNITKPFGYVIQVIQENINDIVINED